MKQVTKGLRLHIVLLVCLLLAGAYVLGKTAGAPNERAALLEQNGNDAVMIQEAIDRAAASRSGSVQLAAHHTYNLTSGIVVKEGVQLELGTGTKLAVNGDFTAVRLEKDASLVNGTIEVTSSAFASKAIYIRGSELYEAGNETFVHNVRVINSSKKPSGTGISLYAKGRWHNVSFVNISDVTVSGFKTGIQLEAKRPAEKSAHSWVNANRFTNISMSDCVTFIRIQGTKNIPNESSGNLFTGLQIQLTKNARKVVQADSSYNKFEGMVWDQQRVLHDGPLISFSEQTEYNEVNMNIRGEKVKDAGEKNQIH